MAISGWPVEDRPRERLLTLGAAALSDAELLAVLESRMEVHLKKPGSIEFAQIFDQVARR